MANQKTDFIVFHTGLKHPKLTWVLETMKQLNIPYEMDKGVVYVGRNHLKAAQSILELPVGKINIRGAQEFPVTLNDLVDSCKAFEVPDKSTDEDDWDWDDDDDDGELEEDEDVTYDDIKGQEFVHAQEYLQYQHVTFPDEAGKIVMYDIESSNLSALAASPAEEPDSLVVYVRFKGGTTYRYYPVKMGVYNDLIAEAVKRTFGIQEASAGSLFHHLVKVPADEGKISCQRLSDTDGWVDVLPKTKRIKEAKKKHKE